MTKRPHFHQGFFKPKNPDRYIGDVNNIVYRSGYERKIFKWLDTSPRIIKWNSEEVVINYISKVDGRVHRYFVDLYFECKDKDGNVKKILAEIKPYAQTIPPKRGKNTTTYINACLTFQKNQDKWKYAKAFAEERGLDFVVLTEMNTGGVLL